MADDYSDLADAFRVTAFIDVLGWSSLTRGIPLLVLRRIAKDETLTPEERDHAEQLRRNMRLARQLSAAIRSVLDEVRELCRPEDDVWGSRRASAFWRHRHVTYIRASDSILAHSSSMQTMSVFVSEILKRGLRRGILFRAGLAGGVAEHSEEPPSTMADARTRDITIIGDGITSAVQAERSQRHSGVHAWLCPRLPALLNEGEDAIGQRRPGTVELFWWTDFRKQWPTSAAAMHCTSPSAAWFDDVIRRLESGPEFDWNRKEELGQMAINDTLDLLRSVRS